MERRKHPEALLTREYERAYKGLEREDLAAGRKVRRAKLVYFIQSASGPIKIGIAIDPRDRMRLIQGVHHEALTLLGAVHGGRLREAALHREFTRYRLRGEWFEPAPELLRRIAEIIGH
jgi:hypothetical protein